MPVIARLINALNLNIIGNLFTTWTAYDDAEQLDNTYQLDDTQQFDEAGELDLLILTYLFNATSSQMAVNTLRIDEHGNLITPQLIQNNGLGLIQIGSDKSLSIAGTLTENASL